MNEMGKLIKAKVISFVDTLLKNYKEINLSEQEAMTLVKLYYLQEDGNSFLDLDYLKKTMMMDEEELSKTILMLVSKEYIKLELKENKDCFNLDPTIARLGLLLASVKDAPISERSKDVGLIIDYVEQVLKKSCSAADLVIINRWVDQGYEFSLIQEAILKTAQNKKHSLNYADAIITSKEKKDNAPLEKDEELKEMMDVINANKKRF